MASALDTIRRKIDELYQRKLQKALSALSMTEGGASGSQLIARQAELLHLIRIRHRLLFIPILPLQQ